MFRDETLLVKRMGSTNVHCVMVITQDVAIRNDAMCSVLMRYMQRLKPWQNMGYRKILGPLRRNNYPKWNGILP